MWTVKRESGRGKNSMSGVDIFEIVFLVVVIVGGVVGFFIAATKED